MGGTIALQVNISPLHMSALSRHVNASKLLGWPHALFFVTSSKIWAGQVRMDGSDRSATDLRMSLPESTGAFVRTTAKPDGTVLLEGTLYASKCKHLKFASSCMRRVLVQDWVTEAAMHSMERNECDWRDSPRHVVRSGASEAVLKESELSRETLQRSADAGEGRLLTDFSSMHSAIMAKTSRGNRCASQPRSSLCLPLKLDHTLISLLTLCRDA